MLTTCFEGSVGLKGDGVKVGGVLHLHIGGILAMQGVLRGDFLAHLKKFFEVPFEAAFGMFLTEAGITPLAGGPGDFVGAFGVGFLGEKSLDTVVKSLGLGLAQTVVAHRDKAHVFVGLTELVDKGGSLFGRSGQKVLQIDRGDSGGMSGC
jgi:hypothetical protein